jgi:hypothetical protein
MAALVAAIHALLGWDKGVDGRNKSGHDFERLAPPVTVPMGRGTKSIPVLVFAGREA